MSRPAGMAQISPHVTRTGIVIAVSPTSDPTHQIQLERANGSSTGTFTQVAMLAGQVGPGQYPTYIDVLPNDGQTRIYRAKAYKQGYTQSTSYTPLLKAKPAIIPEGVTVQTPITGHKIGSNLSLSTAAKLQYGSAAVQSSGKRTTLYPATLMVPDSSGVSYTRVSDGTLSISVLAGSTAYQWQQMLLLPSHATLHQLTVKYIRLTGHTMKWTFTTIQNGAAKATLWTVTNPSTAVSVLTSSSFGPISSTAYDSVLCQLAMRSTAAGKPAFSYTKAVYTVPSYDKTV